MTRNFCGNVTAGNTLLVQTSARATSVNDSRGNVYRRIVPRFWEWILHPIRSLRAVRRGKTFVATNVCGGPTSVTVSGGTFVDDPIEVEMNRRRDVQKLR
jgi:hypothetical protein